VRWNSQASLAGRKLVAPTKGLPELCHEIVFSVSIGFPLFSQHLMMLVRFTEEELVQSSAVPAKQLTSSPIPFDLIFQTTQERAHL
jgi:hypothetical protein